MNQIFWKIKKYREKKVKRQVPMKNAWLSYLPRMGKKTPALIIATIYCVISAEPGTVLVFYICPWSHLILARSPRAGYYPYFIYEEIEAEREIM